MANQPEQRPPEQPWSRAEKNYLLAEIIKTANIDPNNLFMVIVRAGISPTWEETPLPPGRSLNSCRSAYAQFSPQARLPQGLEPQTPVTSTGYQPLRRADYGSFIGSREIRPKPSSGDPYSPGPTTDQPPRKKRGRPTKAEAQAKAEAQIASGGPTPRSEGMTPASAGPAPRPTAEIESPIVAPPSALSRPILPPAPPPAALPTAPIPIVSPTARVPISSMITQTTPTSAVEAGQSSSSSGKRKRGRSTRSDPENYPSTEESSARQVQEYESPYRRAALEPSDTPARAAVLRHREEAEAGAPRFDPPAQSPQPKSGPRNEPDTR